MLWTDCFQTSITLSQCAQTVKTLIHVHHSAAADAAEAVQPAEDVTDLNRSVLTAMSMWTFIMSVYSFVFFRKSVDHVIQ